MVSPDAMATVEVQTKAEDVMEITDSRDSPPLKRKASPEPGSRDEIPKRTRYDADEDDQDRARRPSRSPERDHMAIEAPAPERRTPTQEDKKRGKRLFGGLLSTLNQGPSNAQQKRRQEIEKRQQERMHKQASEDGQRRAERLAQLRAVRVREQIIFDEEVMRNRHVKKLAVARYLQTKAEPKIYYLPWRCTDEEQDVIDEQRRKARELVQREESEFEKRRRWHIERHGAAVRPRPSSPPRERPRSPSAASPGTAVHAESPKKMNSDTGDRDDEGTRHEAHDDAGDIVEHDGEDMVIY
ncbi:pinin/SDK/memA domain protein [Cordyceps fumosorosea ARSEF 2679]|uniref:Pinin/SDK/memA domain protein n=1 Tax=Cordyceps fumosorosea (strain ARSEF 2679) TaxID=1081104 RepID=A0A167ZEY2_CORFA|nr:pinin/SDK/memA domain protein [Cordyceps fumosorosea ARSEF 2679]OAA67433.1 pinin/SDK/memA domain protein [Cordyceps fumosorosea ARSEF 2679]